MNDNVEEIEARFNSYLTKEELINILQTIDFKLVKCADLELITSIIYNAETKEYKPLYKNIRID